MEGVYVEAEDINSVNYYLAQVIKVINGRQISRNFSNVVKTKSCPAYQKQNVEKIIRGRHVSNASDLRDDKIQAIS